MSIVRLTSLPLLGLVACALGSAQKAGPSGVVLCPEFATDTSGWSTRDSFAVGALVELPGAYKRMVFDRTIGTTSLSQVSFWKDGRPARAVRLQRVSVDSAIRFAPTRSSDAMRCTIVTRSGSAQAVLQRGTIPTGGSTYGSQFTIEVQLPVDSKTVVLFVGTSPDSATFKEQLAAARTLKLH